MAADEELIRKIVQYLDDTQNKEVLNEIELLIERSPDNKIVYDEVISIWSRFPDLKKLDQLNNDEAVAKIEQKLIEMDIAGNTSVNEGLGLIKWIAAIAAIILLGILSYWGYLRQQPETLMIKSTGKTVDSVMLADGSKIYLDKYSAIKYPVAFKNSIRGISLVKGQAFFKIHRDTLHPFVIHINKSSVTVLGTSFNIDTHDNKITLNVSTGLVKFLPLANKEDGALLHAGTGIIYNETEGTEELLHSVNTNNRSWLTHELNFVDASLNDVCKELELYYNIKISLAGKTSAFKKLNANFKDNKLSDVLEVLRDTYPVRIKHLTADSILIQSIK